MERVWKLEYSDIENVVDRLLGAWWNLQSVILFILPSFCRCFHQGWSNINKELPEWEDLIAYPLLCRLQCVFVFVLFWFCFCFLGDLLHHMLPHHGKVEEIIINVCKCYDCPFSISDVLICAFASFFVTSHTRGTLVLLLFSKSEFLDF